MASDGSEILCKNATSFLTRLDTQLKKHQQHDVMGTDPYLFVFRSDDRSESLNSSGECPCHKGFLLIHPSDMNRFRLLNTKTFWSEFSAVSGSLASVNIGEIADDYRHIQAIARHASRDALDTIEEGYLPQDVLEFRIPYFEGNSY